MTNFIVHIGDGKCGSSAIQAALFDAQAALRDAGIGYYSHHRTSGNFCLGTLVGKSTRGNDAQQRKYALKAIDELIHARSIKWEWVKGHSGDPLNERADRLAHGAATSISNQKKNTNEEEDLSENTDGEKVELTHIDSGGAASMVDVGSKLDTKREATAKGFVRMKSETIKLILENNFGKGDVLAVARIAGIMGAKETSRLIPLCHPIPLTQVTIDFDIDEKAMLIGTSIFVQTALENI